MLQFYFLDVCLLENSTEKFLLNTMVNSVYSNGILWNSTWNNKKVHALCPVNNNLNRCYQQPSTKFTMFHIMFILRCKLKLCDDIEFGEKRLCITVFKLKHELTTRLLASVKFLTNSQIHVFSTFDLLDKKAFFSKMWYHTFIYKLYMIYVTQMRTCISISHTYQFWIVL